MARFGGNGFTVSSGWERFPDQLAIDSPTDPLTDFC